MKARWMMTSSSTEAAVAAAAADGAARRVARQLVPVSLIAVARVREPAAVADRRTRIRWLENAHVVVVVVVVVCVFVVVSAVVVYVFLVVALSDVSAVADV